MSVVIIDYGSGNLHSAQKAFEKASKSLSRVETISVTAEPELIADADRIVLPGVGAFADCKAGLSAATGVLQAMEEAVLKKGRPFLGICVGMQLLADRGLEHGVHRGMSWINGQVAPLEPDDSTLKIPHMGWNTLDIKRDHALLKGIPTGETGQHAYFVHSYHFVPESTDNVIAVTNYGGSVTAMIGRDNIAGTQFHPEKSQKLGLALIANFLRWAP